VRGTGIVSLGGLLVGFLLASTPLRAGNKQLARALSSEGAEIRSVIDHEFVDLDGDGIKEAVVHGRGNFRGVTLARSRGITFHPPKVDPQGHRVLLPSTLAWGRFVGIFRFERASFHWYPVLIGTYRREKGWVTGLGVISVGEVKLVQVSFEEAGTVRDRLYRLTKEGVEEVFSSRRGTWMGEGFLHQGAKILLTQGLPNPFAPGGRPGLLARTRYRWKGDRFRSEYWKLWGQGFRPDFEVEGEEAPPGSPLGRARALQQEVDQDSTSPRLTLPRLAKRRFRDSPVRVVYQRGAYGVVVVRVNREDHPHYFVRPFYLSRGEGRAAWMELAELVEDEGAGGG
jgi:hypothetical protein